MLRQPAVAGQFYSSERDRLQKDLAGLITSQEEQERAIGVVSPHAGYIYSGAVAGALFGAIRIPRTVVILGPNHHGVGARAALYPSGSWATPLGTVPINDRLSSLCSRHAPLLEPDTLAHLHEHSLEVQLPFLRAIRPDVAIVPVCIGFGRYQECEELGMGLALAIREYGEEVLIVASSDMTHYEPADQAREKDGIAIREILALNPSGLLGTCRSRGITMCGVVPATVMLIAAKELGANRARLVRYANSGDVNGDVRQVVGYAAVTVS
ncbi:AmmeMemoRadiSam system protein B [Geobacter argillaceus]|uniref:MEMO1 family protein JN12_02398 n=1 Tax=Geobacter argillaceus TaxID=345631 RepID=A0A562VLC2_9BACT|nr:AmmeMemoRadiSam system protein B [Geobacter argillaceus]TWJ18763.1 hypothetical protein JN12_02398 [Geobacter argillaceus]